MSRVEYHRLVKGGHAVTFRIKGDEAVVTSAVTVDEEQHVLWNVTTTKDEARDLYRETLADGYAAAPRPELPTDPTPKIHRRRA